MQASVGELMSVTQFFRAPSMECVTLQDNPVSDQPPLPQTPIVPVPKIRKALQDSPHRDIRVGGYIVTALISGIFPSFHVFELLTVTISHHGGQKCWG